MEKRALDIVVFRRSTSKASVYRVINYHKPPQIVQPSPKGKHVMHTNGNQDIITLNRGKGLKKKKTTKQTKNYE